MVAATFRLRFDIRKLKLAATEPAVTECWNGDKRNISESVTAGFIVIACEHYYTSVRDMNIREKKHRLPKDFYGGKISVAFTLCLKGEIEPFLKPETVQYFTDILTTEVTKQACIVPVYCFMPDHQHIIITGITGDSNIWKIIVKYKQRTGYWMSANNLNIRWQKDFYDHILRTEKEVVRQVRYILDNPVRKGLVTFWGEHPFKGSIGCSLHDVLTGIM